MLLFVCHCGLELDIFNKVEVVENNYFSSFKFHGHLYSKGISKNYRLFPQIPINDSQA